MLFPMNKCFCLKSFINHKNSFLINDKIINTISTKIHKRFYTKFDKKINKFIISNKSWNQLIVNHLMARSLSKVNALSKTNKETTTSPLKTITEEKAEVKGTVGQKPIGIVGFDNWEQIKKVKEWKPIYYFPYISHLGTFQRMKLWLSVLSCGLVPITFTLYTFGLVGGEVLITYGLISLFSLFGLYIIGNRFRRFVGRIYISDDESLVRLSHLSFFGYRIDDNIDAKDIVPLSDTNFKLNDFYCRIERYSTDQVLYMSLKYGGITDRENFDKVFGENASNLLVRNK